ncbi:putative prolyl 4-hydroxylase 7 [Cocos nucifera]|uniref:Putative prolyl 4-hydroxylase 7 n=1 Tax=Cocos nucifera TaxID=13894 RepID=A0A8K0N578_COCNU|nr:putative prolyl 4-hydroxylase 7 [Cocos nucifera]
MGFSRTLPLLFVPLLFLAAIPSFCDSAVLPSLGKGDPAFFDPMRVTQLSWHPRAFLYKGFLSDEECDHLISLARDKLEKSMVADNDSGKSVMSEVRTSSGMFLEKHQVGHYLAIFHNKIIVAMFGSANGHSEVERFVAKGRG